MSLRSPRRHSREGRDAALERLRWVNRSVIAGSVALTAIFADTAANTFAGGTAHAKNASAASGRATKHKSSARKAGESPLAPPSEAPQQAAPRTETEQQATPTQEEAAPSQGEAAPAQQAAPEAQQTEAPVEQHTEAPVEQHTESAPEPAQEEAPVVSGGS
jgi:hypothetical protein